MANKFLYPAFLLIIVVLIVAIFIAFVINSVRDSIPSCTKDGEKMTVMQAIDIASLKCGNLSRNYFCNENSGTWWIELNMTKAGCNPACVVDVSTGQAEINWRCTGLIQCNVSNFDECADAGYPVMESYPRQCNCNGQTFVENISTEAGCTNSGGTLETSLCCNSANDFPNTCLIGACGCAPESSHNVTICNCGEDKCFDGTRCV